MNPRIHVLPNRPTHHLLRYLLMHGGGRLDALIAAAFDRAYENHHHAGHLFDDYEIVRYELAELLQEWFFGRFPWIVEAHVNDPREKAALLHPLLKLAVDQIEWEEVAEALLRQLGKWSPDDAAPAYRLDDDDDEDDHPV